jgi:release factor glutamine methyltransferase
MNTANCLNLALLDTSQQAQYLAMENSLTDRLSLLVDKPEETAATTLAALWHFASEVPLSVLRATTKPLPSLTPQQFTSLAQLIEKRLSGVPLAHMTGRQNFMGIELLSSTDALIPRAETALLGEAALTKLRAFKDKNRLTVIDVCTGSGNLALALAAHEPRSQVWGADLSPEATALATRNAIHTGLKDRVTFRTGNLLVPYDEPMFLGNVDLLVCNPPYISSGKVTEMADEISAHEPRLAFDGGPLGIAILQRLIAEAPRFLCEGGWLALEIGLGQGRGVRRKLGQQKYFAEIEETLDAHGQVRALMARRTNEQYAVPLTTK